jgi:MFS family permease
MTEQKLWTKNYVAITLIFFLLSIVFFLLMSTMGIYATEQFGVSASIAGLAASIFIVSSSFARIGTGRVLSYASGKRILLLGLVFCVAVNILYFFVHNVVLLLIVRFLHGIGAGVATTVLPTMIAFVIPSARRAEGIGNFMSSGMLASAIGPFLGILLQQAGSTSLIYLLCLFLGIACLVLAFFAELPEVHQSRPPQEVFEKSTKKLKLKFSDFFERLALPIASVVLITSIAYSSIMTFLPLYAKEINLLKAASVYFVFHAAGAIFTRPFMGKLMDRRGANIVTYPVLIIFAIGLLIVSRAQSAPVLFTGAVLIGFGFGNINSIGQTIAIAKVPPLRVGMATSTYFIAMDLGLGVGPYILGLMIPFIGYRGIYLFAFMVLIGCIVLYYFMHGAKEAREKKTQQNA